MNADTESRLRSALTTAAARIESTPPPVQVIADAAAARARRPAPFRVRVLLPAAAVALVAGLAGVLVAIGSDTHPTGHHVGPDASAGSPSTRPAYPQQTHSKPAPSTTSARQLSNLPACRRGDLVLSYRAGGLATGNDFGSLEVRNASVGDCQLTGSITVTALDGSGQPIRVQQPWHNTVTPHRVPMTGRGKSGDAAHWYELLVGGNMRNPQDTSTCPPSAVVTPAEWRVAGAVRGEVANRDPGVNAHGFVPRLFACSDHGAVLLLNVAGVPQP